MPMNRSLYPDNWDEISQAIRLRAGNKCERCGVANYDIGFRDENDKWISHSDDWSSFGKFYRSYRVVKIILTVAHLDQDPSHNDPSNLACLCQRCHLNHDRPYNLIKRHKTWMTRRWKKFESSGQQRLPLDGVTW